jgi:hypothetical protein
LVTPLRVIDFINPKINPDLTCWGFFIQKNYYANTRENSN